MSENNILGLWIDIVVLECVVTFSFGQKSLNIIISRNAKEKLCKRIQLDKNEFTLSVRYKYVCVNRSDKYIDGCDTYDDK